MNIKHILTISLLVASNIAINTATATTSTNELLLYQFAESKDNKKEISHSLMDRFLPKESAERLTALDGQTARYVSKKDVNTTFEYDYLTGNFQFKRDFSDYLGDFEPTLPSSNESIKITRSFLEKNELQAKNKDQFKLAHVGGLRASSVTEDGKAGAIVDKLVTLHYSREINGLPVIGPGSKFIVHLGHKGKIVGLTRHWRELNRKAISLDYQEIYNEDEAFEQAKRSIASEFGKGASFEVLQHQMAYYDNNGSFLQPVHAFQVKVQLANYDIEPFDYVSVIQAMKKPQEDLKLRAVDRKALLKINKATTVESIEESKTETKSD